jgi:hypothetical protein
VVTALGEARAAVHLGVGRQTLARALAGLSLRTCSRTALTLRLSDRQFMQEVACGGSS